MGLKKLVLGAFTVLSVMVLAACGQSKANQNLQASIQEKGKLVVAISPDYAPFEFKALIDGKDTIVGADVELAKAIAAELGVELELSAMSFDNVLASLKTGKADLAISGLSLTAERAKVYDFSAPYYTTENAILVKKADLAKYKTLADLSGLKVAAQKGTIEEGLAKEQLTDSNIVALTAMGEAINELKNGQVQAVTLEKPVAEGYVSQNDDLVILDVALEVGEGDAKAVAMPKNSPELKATVDKVIAALEKDGKYKQFITEAAALTADAVE